MAVEAKGHLLANPNPIRGGYRPRGAAVAAEVDVEGGEGIADAETNDAGRGVGVVLAPGESPLELGKCPVLGMGAIVRVDRDAEALDPLTKLLRGSHVSSSGAVVRVAESRLPEDLKITKSFVQDLLLDASKARGVMGWDETNPANGCRQAPFGILRIRQTISGRLMRTMRLSMRVCKMSRLQ